MNKEEMSAREKILHDAMKELKEKASDVIQNVMSGLYTDYLPHIETDTEANIGYRVQGCLRNMVAGKFDHVDEDRGVVVVNDGYGHGHMISLQSYAVTLKPLCDLMGKTIENERIKQLENEIEGLRQSLNNYHRY